MIAPNYEARTEQLKDQAAAILAEIAQREEQQSIAQQKADQALQSLSDAIQQLGALSPDDLPMLRAQVIAKFELEPSSEKQVVVDSEPEAQVEPQPEPQPELVSNVLSIYHYPAIEAVVELEKPPLPTTDRCSANDLIAYKRGEACCLGSNDYDLLVKQGEYFQNQYFGDIEIEIYQYPFPQYHSWEMRVDGLDFCFVRDFAAFTIDIDRFEENLRPKSELDQAEELLELAARLKLDTNIRDLSEPKKEISFELVGLSKYVGYMKNAQNEVVCGYVGSNNKAKLLEWGQWLTKPERFGGRFEVRPAKRVTKFKHELKLWGLSLNQLQRLAKEFIDQSAPSRYHEPSKATASRLLAP